MPLFWRGASIGSFWHVKDARLSGFTAQFPGGVPSIARMVQHIALGTAASPFVSLSRSFAVAWSYAVLLSGLSASSTNPAYVYEVELDSPLPPGLMLLDPIKEISNQFSDPVNGCPYHHDGLPSFLLGVVDPKMRRYLTTNAPRPPVAGSSVMRVPNLSDELTTLVRVLRDSEVLAVGAIPATSIRQRYNVY